MKRSALLFLMALAAGPVSAADAPYSLEARGATVIVPDDVKLPSCSHPGLFRRIASEFHDKESEYWNSSLRLTSFEEPAEIAYRPWGIEFLPRRFCHTRAMVSDGSVHDVHYAVIYKAGTLGIAHDVEWCVSGFDRNLAYAPGCRMAGP